MIAARQELDLRPQLERIDALLLRSVGVDPGALRFAFRPLWQLSAQEKAQVALAKAQATQVYAGLGLWPAGVVARLAEGQLLEDGTYPTAAAVFGSGSDDGSGQGEERQPVTDFNVAQLRDPQGRWTMGGGGQPPSSEQGPSSARSDPAGVHRVASGTSTGAPSSILGGLLRALNPIGTASAQEGEPEREEEPAEEAVDPTQEVRTARYNNAINRLRTIDPDNKQVQMWTEPNHVPTESDVQFVEAIAEAAANKRVRGSAKPAKNSAPPDPASSPRVSDLYAFPARPRSTGPS